MKAEKKEYRISPEFCNAYDYVGTELGAKMHASRHFAGKITIYEKTDLVAYDSDFPVYKEACVKTSEGWFPGCEDRWI